MSTIAERLREFVDSYRGSRIGVLRIKAVPLAEAAADEIDRLTSERDVFREKLSELAARNEATDEDDCELCGGTGELEASVHRAEAGRDTVSRDLAGIARAALNASAKEGDA